VPCCCCCCSSRFDKAVRAIRRQLGKLWRVVPPGACSAGWDESDSWSATTPLSLRAALHTSAQVEQHAHGGLLQQSIAGHQAHDPVPRTLVRGGILLQHRGCWTPKPQLLPSPDARSVCAVRQDGPLQVTVYVTCNTQGQSAHMVAANSPPSVSRLPPTFSASPSSSPQ
jgi:hypothetical protein